MTTPALGITAEVFPQIYLSRQSTKNIISQLEHSGSLPANFIEPPSQKATIMIERYKNKVFLYALFDGQEAD